MNHGDDEIVVGDMVASEIFSPISSPDYMDQWIIGIYLGKASDSEIRKNKGVNATYSSLTDTYDSWYKVNWLRSPNEDVVTYYRYQSIKSLRKNFKRIYWTLIKKYEQHS